MAKTGPIGRSSEELLTAQMRAIYLYQRDTRVMEIVRLSGLSYRAVRLTIAKFEERKNGQPKFTRPGRRMGSGRSLNPEQERRLRRLIIQLPPSKCQLNHSLWSQEVVGQLIEREYGLDLHTRSVGKYLSRWGFLHKKSGDTRNPGGSKKYWPNLDLWQISDLARDKNGEVHFFEVAGLQRSPQARQKDSDIAFRPSAGNNFFEMRGRIQLISRATQGKTRWMVVKDELTAAKVLTFMRSLTQDIQRKVFLILEDKAIYRSDEINRWIKKRTNKIELFFYSYNPQIKQLPQFPRIKADDSPPKK